MSGPGRGSLDLPHAPHGGYAGVFLDPNGEIAHNPVLGLDEHGALILPTLVPPHRRLLPD